MKKIDPYQKFDNLFNNSPEIKLNNSDKYVIFSDFHIGNRKMRDDFTKNSAMFIEIIKGYYFEKGYKLILNGDVEELQRVKLSTIKSKWADLYSVFDEFDRDGRFYKIVGNHDAALYKHKHSDINRKLFDGLRFDYFGNKIFIFHGHQLSSYYTRLHSISGFFLRYIVNPLGIKNITRSYINQKLLKTELKIYEYSKSKGIISIVGHTHRPLFESMSEIEVLKIKIENLIRSYMKANDENKELIKLIIEKYRDDIEKMIVENGSLATINATYNNNLTIPAIFNCGCVIGKNGITAIEFENGHISLVIWYDKNKKNRYFKTTENCDEHYCHGEYIRKVLKKDTIDYIFARIKLLTEQY